MPFILDGVPHIIYFVRHGESLGNVKRQLLPVTEDALTDTGMLQAKLLGNDISDVKFTKAISSHLPRAGNTAKIILDHSKTSFDLKIDSEPMLKERDFGVFEGQSYSVAAADVVKQKVHPLKWDPLGGESFEALRNRASTFLENLFKTLDEISIPQTVLVVSHSSFLMMLLTEVLSSSSRSNYLVTHSVPDPDLKLKLIGNTQYFVISVERNSKECKDQRKIHFDITLGDGHLRELKNCETSISDEYAAYAKNAETGAPNERKGREQ